MQRRIETLEFRIDDPRIYHVIVQREKSTRGRIVWQPVVRKAWRDVRAGDRLQSRNGKIVTVLSVHIWEARGFGPEITSGREWENS